MLRKRGISILKEEVIRFCRRRMLLFYNTLLL